MILLSTWWDIQNDDRRQEVLNTLLQNKRSCFFDDIYLLVDFDKCHNICYDIFWDNHIYMVQTEEPITYKNFIDYANMSHDGLIVVANADILFDHTIMKCRDVDYLKKNDKYTKLLVITRHPTRSRELENPGSQDVWVFKTPLFEFYNDIVMGVNGCDSYLAQKAIEAGMTVINPALSIDIWHNHLYYDIKERKEVIKSYWSYSDYKYQEVPYSRL